MAMGNWQIMSVLIHFITHSRWYHITMENGATLTPYLADFISDLLAIVVFSISIFPR